MEFCWEGVAMKCFLGHRARVPFLTVSITAAIFLCSPAAWAQGVRRFETYTKALDGLLVLQGKAQNFDMPDDMPPNTNCNLTDDPADINNGRIGPNLSRHCTGRGNATNGSILGGSLVSTQSTRTVSQFGLRSRRTERPRTDKPTKSPFVAGDYRIGDAFERWLFPVENVPSAAPIMLMRLAAVDDFPTGELRSVGGRLSLFATFEHQRVDHDATVFEYGFQSHQNRATIGFA
jgi:hypothetical protein